MTKYMMGKFMRAVEMSDAVIDEYVADPTACVDSWLAGSSVPTQERDAFVAGDYEALYILGAHPYLLWHFAEAIYTHEFSETFGWRDLVERYRTAVTPHGVPDYIA